MIQAARLSIPLVPAAQRPLAELLLSEADRINTEYEQLKAHIAEMTRVINQLSAQVHQQSAAIEALRGATH